jgi:hypothetical protein
MDGPMMRSAEFRGTQNLVGIGREVPVREKQKLDGLPEILLAQEKRIRTGFYVSHVDIYFSQCYIPGSSEETIGLR